MIFLPVCDKIVNCNQWRLPGDIPLPVKSVTERIQTYTVTERERTEEEALALADRVLTERLEGYLEEGKILSRDLTCAKVGDTLMVTLSAECEEQIGKLVDMPADDGEGR